MILFKRSQLTQEYFLQHTNEDDKKDIYLRETITSVEYFDKKINTEEPIWYLIKNQKKQPIPESKRQELELHWQTEMETQLNKQSLENESH